MMTQQIRSLTQLSHSHGLLKHSEGSIRCENHSISAPHSKCNKIRCTSVLSQSGWEITRIQSELKHKAVAKYVSSLGGLTRHQTSTRANNNDLCGVKSNELSPQSHCRPNFWPNAESKFYYIGYIGKLTRHNVCSPPPPPI